MRDGRVRLAVQRQQSHQLSVARLVERLQRDLLPGVGGCVAVPSAPLGMFRQVLERAQRPMAQILPLQERPFLERRGAFDRKTLKEVATPQAHRLTKHRRAAPA